MCNVMCIAIDESMVTVGVLPKLEHSQNNRELIQEAVQSQCTVWRHWSPVVVVEIWLQPSYAALAYMCAAVEMYIGFHWNRGLGEVLAGLKIVFDSTYFPGQL